MGLPPRDLEIASNGPIAPGTAARWPVRTIAEAPHAGGGLQPLRPLFTTSSLIDDFMAENGFFGARQLVLSSASSKTAFGTALCLARRLADLGGAT